MMKTDKLNISYLRLSLEDEDVAKGKNQESNSIQSQRLCIREYIEKHLDLPSNFIEYVDDGYSGTSMNRPGMQQILKMVYEGKVSTIIVRDLSRFARNYLEAGHLLEYVFPIYDVRFIAINDQFDSASLADSTVGAFQLAIRNLLNDLYSKDISRKVKSTIDLKKMNGEYAFGQVPYGYEKGKEKNTIVVDEAAAIWVRTIFRLASEGFTNTQIARSLNEKKVNTPSVYLAKKRGNYKIKPIWTYNSIKNILENRTYTGDIEPFKSHVVHVGSSRVNQIPQEERTIIPNTHEAIITREMFELVQKRTSQSKKKSTEKNKNLLAGYLVCSCCGNRLVKGRTTNKNWLCATARYIDTTACRQIKIADEQVREVLSRAIQTQYMIAAAKMENMEGKQKTQNQKLLLKQLDQAEKEIKELSDKLLKLLEEYYAENITKEIFIKERVGIKEKKLELEKEKRKLEHKLSNLCLKEKYMYEEQEHKEIQTEKIKSLDEVLLKELVKEIVVYPNHSVQINWMFQNILK